jgi:hypothetical protein
VDTDSNGEAEFMRAVVIVTENTEKGTPRNGQEYIAPLLTLTGREYAAMTFAALYERICDALRAGGPRVTIQTLSPSGRRRIHFEDGSIRDV